MGSSAAGEHTPVETSLKSLNGSFRLLCNLAEHESPQWASACRTAGIGAWRRQCIPERKEDPQFKALNRAMSPHCAEAIDVDGRASAIGNNSQ